MNEDKRTIDCDQVAEIMGALVSVMARACGGKPATDEISLAFAQAEALLVIMRILHLEFEDAGAAGNALYQLHAFDVLRGIK